MKNYTLKQIEKALANKGFYPHMSHADNITSWIFEHENGHSTFYANVDGDLLTIDRMNPTDWYNSIKKEL
jgi:hypothetical protein